MELNFTIIKPLTLDKLIFHFWLSHLDPSKVWGGENWSREILESPLAPMILNTTTFLVIEVTGFISEICFNMGEPRGHYTNQKKPVTKGQILYDSTHMKYLKS